MRNDIVQELHRVSCGDMIGAVCLNGLIPRERTLGLAIIGRRDIPPPVSGHSLASQCDYGPRVRRLRLGDSSSGLPNVYD